MTKFIASLFALLLFASLALGQHTTLADELRQMKKEQDETNQTLAKALLDQQRQINGITSTQARMQGDVANAQDDVLALKEEMAALRKLVAPRASFVPAKMDEWGRGTPAVFRPTTQAIWQPEAQETYSSGNCANGSCSTGRQGLFGRLRGRK